VRTVSGNTLTHSPGPAGNPGSNPGPPDDPGSRGRLVLHEKVVKKIAAQAAGEASVTGGSSGGFLGIGSRPDFSARPRAEVELSGNIATLSVTVGLRYPVPLRQATEELRQRIMDRVTALTGLDVRQVDITVSWLTASEDGRGPRRLL
jgi:uncharacterized alkaline shock family protein YloU